MAVTTLQDLQDDILQKIAVEINLSDTAFIKLLDKSDTFKDSDIFGLRWFTPKAEVKLCGHATLTSAAVLFEKIGNKQSRIVFKTLSGELIVKREGKLFHMDFPVGLTVREDESVDFFYLEIRRQLVQAEQHGPCAQQHRRNKPSFQIWKGLERSFFPEFTAGNSGKNDFPNLFRAGKTVCFSCAIRDVMAGLKTVSLSAPAFRSLLAKGEGIIHLIEDYEMVGASREMDSEVEKRTTPDPDRQVSISPLDKTRFAPHSKPDNSCAEYQLSDGEHRQPTASGKYRHSIAEDHPHASNSMTLSAPLPTPTRPSPLLPMIPYQPQWEGVGRECIKKIFPNLSRAGKAEERNYEKLVKSLGNVPEMSDIVYCDSLRYLLIRLQDGWSRKEFEAWTPDIGAINASTDKLIVLIITTRGPPGDGYHSASGAPYDFVSRCFAPWMNVPEDPVCGSAHTVLAHYWSQQLGKQDFFVKQCSARGGEIWLRLRGGRVEILGKTAFVMEGEMKF